MCKKRMSLLKYIYLSILKFLGVNSGQGANEVLGAGAGSYCEQCAGVGTYVAGRQGACADEGLGAGANASAESDLGGRKMNIKDFTMFSRLKLTVVIGSESNANQLYLSAPIETLYSRYIIYVCVCVCDCITFQTSF